MVTYCLWAFLIAAQLAALVRILSLASREYRWFTAVLAFDLLRAGTFIALRSHPNASGWFWVFSEPVALAMLAAATWEIVRRIPREHPLYQEAFQRTKPMLLLQLALVIVLVSAFIEARTIVLNSDSTPWLPATIALKRLITSILAIYLVLITRSVSKTPVIFRPNLIRHSFLFAAYLLLISTVMLWQNVLASGRGTVLSNAVLTLGSGMLFILWSQLLTRRGERTAGAVRSPKTLGITSTSLSKPHPG